MKILYDSRNGDKDISHLYRVKGKKDAYRLLEERKRDKVRKECSRCPVCGEFEYTFNDLDLRRITNIEVKMEVLKYEVIQGYFLKNKIPVVYKYIYSCKKCGTIYESEEVNMEQHVCLLK